MVKEYLLIQYNKETLRASIMLTNETGLIVKASIINEILDEKFIALLKNFITNPLNTACICSSLEEFRDFSNRVTELSPKKERSFILSIKTKYLSFYSDLSEEVRNFLFEIRENTEMKKMYQMFRIAGEYLVDSKAFEKRVQRINKALNLDVQNITIEDIIGVLKEFDKQVNLHVVINERGIDYIVTMAGITTLRDDNLTKLYKNLKCLLA